MTRERQLLHVTVQAVAGLSGDTDPFPSPIFDPAITLANMGHQLIPNNYPEHHHPLKQIPIPRLGLYSKMGYLSERSLD